MSCGNVSKHCQVRYSSFVGYLSSICGRYFSEVCELHFDDDSRNFDSFVLEFAGNLGACLRDFCGKLHGVIPHNKLDLSGLY